MHKIKTIAIYEWTLDGKWGVWGLRLAYDYASNPINKGDTLELECGEWTRNFKVEQLGYFSNEPTVIALYGKEMV